MDLLTLTLNKNHLWTGLSFVGLGTFTYLTNRYLTNTKETSNQTYYKPCEVIKGIPNLTILNNNTNILIITILIILLTYFGMVI